MIIRTNNQLATSTSSVSGAKFKKSSFFRPTTMSLALAKAGIIPGTHMVGENAAIARLRNRNDVSNLRPSVVLAF